MKKQTAETKVLKIMKKAGKPVQAYEIIQKMGWGYSSEASAVIRRMGDTGQIVRSWDEQGNVYYTR